MTGDCHVRFCERLRGEIPLCLLGVKTLMNIAGLSQTKDIKNKNGKRSFEYFPSHNLVNRSSPNYVKLLLL
jgi:hypothetical protein